METIYLYVKQHKIGPLKYFGKTQRDPYKYIGSGSRWLNHIKVHGRDGVETLHVWQFDCIEEASQFAIQYSRENNIVGSEQWANLTEEDAYAGAGKGNTPWNVGVPSSKATKQKTSDSVKRYWRDNIHPRKGKASWNSGKTNCYSKETIDRFKARKGNKSKARSWHFQTADGIIEVFNLTKFCKEHDLSIGIMRRIGNSQRDEEYRGFSSPPV